MSGAAVRYADWVLPGVLAMNVMFSSLWGVGWVIVRYRKNGVLRRLKATPLSPFEFLTAQVLSRLLVVMSREPGRLSGRRPAARLPHARLLSGPGPRSMPPAPSA